MEAYECSDAGSIAYTPRTEDVRRETARRPRPDRTTYSESTRSNVSSFSAAHEDAARPRRAHHVIEWNICAHDRERKNEIDETSLGSCGLRPVAPALGFAAIGIAYRIAAPAAHRSSARLRGLGDVAARLYGIGLSGASTRHT